LRAYLAESSADATEAKEKVSARQVATRTSEEDDCRFIGPF
jgi:hypothetical protein